MVWKVLIAHAEGEEAIAESLAKPLRNAGYEVAHQGTVLVGESIQEEASKVLELGGPVILCATIKAIGTGLPNRLIRAARLDVKKRIFIVQIDKGAYIDSVSHGEKIALYWQDPNRAINDLLKALNRYYPPKEAEERAQQVDDAEDRYRTLLLRTCDIINLSNLPVQNPNLAQSPLKLRSLFVPLHAWVEVEALEDDEVNWMAIEKKDIAILEDGIYPEELGHEYERVKVGERLIKDRRLVVLGDPGSGKTTLIRWIATAYLLRLEKDPNWQALPDIETLPNADLLPIIVKCRNFDASSMEWTLQDILFNTLRKLELSERDAGALTQSLLDRMHLGTALLMVDGLDEITDICLRSSFCQQLEQISLAYPNALILVTSRIVGYRELGQKLGHSFKRITLTDLSPKEKDNFAHRWCELTESHERQFDAERELVHGIHSNDRIERLTGNPMLLTTMALVKRNVGKLPSRRADLYWEAVQVMLNWRSDVGEALDQHEAIPQLEYLAFAMCDQGAQQMRHDLVLELIDKMRDEYPKVHQARNHSPEDFLHLLETRTSLLVMAGHVRYSGRVEPVYEFRHQTFQEYLAAMALVDKRFPGRNPKLSLAENVAPLAGRIKTPVTGDETIEAVVEESWSETLRLCTAICSDDDVDDVIIAILNPMDGEAEEISHDRALLASLCIADEPNVGEDTVHEVLKVFARKARDIDVIIGSNADVMIKEMIGTRWVALLHNYLIEEFCRCDSSRRWILGTLAGAIGMDTTPRDANNLQKWLIDQTIGITNCTEQDAISISLTTVKLANEGEIHEATRLAKGLLTRLEGSAPLAHASSWALSSLIGNREERQRTWKPTSFEIDYILTFVENPEADTQAVSHLITILGKENINSAIKLLILRLNDSEIIIRRSAAFALGEMKSREAAKSLIALLADSDITVRRSAASALGKIKSKEAIEPLIALLADPDTTVRRSAAFALGRIKSKEAIEPLIALLADPDTTVRRSVARVLGEMKSKDAVKPLIALLADPAITVRRSAASALGEMKREEAIEPLIALLAEPDLAVRRSAARVLGEMKREEAIEPIITLLANPDITVRRSAASALGDMKSKDAVKPLIALLADPDATVRRSAARALGGIKSKDAVKPLIALLADPDTTVRRTAARVLGEMKREEAIKPLIALLADPDATVRRSAAHALGDMKSKDAVKPLIALLADPDTTVRRSVACVLGEMKREEAIEPLIALLADPDITVRRSAAIALGKIKSEEAIEPLIALLADPDTTVRRSAAIALGDMKSKDAVKPLISLLADSDITVRRSATIALGNMESKEAIEPLIALLADPDITVRRSATIALGNMESKEAIEPLIALLADPDITVRRTVAYALRKIKSI